MDKGMDKKIRNAALDFWEFIFSVIIVLYHIGDMPWERPIRFIPRGGIGVEFFL